jgi:sn-glycerol 3-phosphate transport system ATP-binding protein
MAQIIFENVSKSFGNTHVIQNLNLTIQDGTFTVLVGASGCGKTTLLRMIAGIGPATSGRILMDGKNITDVAPGRRDVGMVFQNYAIYPTMSVRENIEFGLRNRNVRKAERKRLIEEICESVGLAEYLDRKPGSLSGGQRQRVALARAMVKKPKVFLMDEPLSNLDAKLRAAMRVELIELHEKLKTTFVYVTHDQIEAMSMADTIILMEKGKIMQEGTPRQIYSDPGNIFIAQFIGSPAMNVIELADGLHIGFRPEKARLSVAPPDIRDAGAPPPFQWEGTIVTHEMLGAETLYKVSAGGTSVMAKSQEDNFKMGDKAHLSVEDSNLYFFDSKGDRLRGSAIPDYRIFSEARGGILHGQREVC